MSDEQHIGSNEQDMGGWVEPQWEYIYYNLDSYFESLTSKGDAGEGDMELKRAATLAQVEQARQLCRIADVLTAMLARG